MGINRRKKAVTEEYEKKEQMSDKKHWNWKKYEDESVQLVLLFFYFAFQKYNVVFLYNLGLLIFSKLKYICVRERHLYGCRCMALSFPIG